MRSWSTLLAGLAVWLLHFALVYVVPSLDAVGAAPSHGLRWVHDLGTLACLTAAASLAMYGWRRSRQSATGPAFRERIGALGAAIAALAIIWQAAPAWVTSAHSG